MATFAARPAENTDPWYAAREAYDASVEAAINGMPADIGPWYDRNYLRLSTAQNGLGASNISQTYVVPNANTVRLVPIRIPDATVTYVLMGIINITAAAVAGSKARLGLFRQRVPTTGDGRTFDLLYDGGEVSTDTTGQKVISGLSYTIPQPGWYWLGLNCDAVFSMTGFTATSGFGHQTTSTGMATTVTIASQPYGPFASEYTNVLNAFGGNPTPTLIMQ